jgi:acyl carrier protein
MKDTLRRYISEQLLSDQGGAFADDADLLDSGIDSVGMASLVLFIEGEWSLTIPPEDVILENFQTIARIEEYLRGRSLEVK